MFPSVGADPCVRPYGGGLFVPQVRQHVPYGLFAGTRCGLGGDKDGPFCGVVIESRSRFPVAPFVGADGMEASEFATLFAAVFPDFLFALRAVGLDGLRYEVLSVRGLQQVGQPRQSAGMV